MTVVLHKSPQVFDWADITFFRDPRQDLNVVFLEKFQGPFKNMVLCHVLLEFLKFVKASIIEMIFLQHILVCLTVLPTFQSHQCPQTLYFWNNVLEKLSKKQAITKKKNGQKSILFFDIHLQYKEQKQTTIVFVTYDPQNDIRKKQKMQQQQNSNNQPMNCKIDEHFQQQYYFFKFSEKIGEILQCMNCNLEDPQNDKKIIIDQILKFPSSKILNFPPLKNQKNCKQIQKIMQNFTKDKIKQFKEYVNTQINNYYQKLSQDINQVLLQSKKDVLQQFENILEFTNVSEFYDIAPVKEMIEKYQKNDIDLEQLFDQQLKMKESLEDEQKFNIAINQEKIQNEVQNLIQNLKVQLDEKIGIFKERIVINTQRIKKYKKEIQDVQQEKPQQNQENQYQIQFYKSNNPYNLKQEIEIKNNSRRIKMKINFQESLEYNLGFVLLGLNDKDNGWGGQNYIFINDINRNCGAGNGEREIVEGQGFIDFWEDDVSILNVVFNYQEKLLEVFDDQRKGYVKNVINQNIIKGDKVVLGIYFYQNYKSKIDLSIVDIQQY
ncbi:hypothetical protein PPERSA_00134 [Pseudocohnilembus persalinus]|uniref:Uncharacterized protein n=1 Tax=Pseudocohnilembus persalinus TaxID=266149 RepID=A0A0V0QCX0_PSEPJ|nr:hypothetical protein PPERSA_00134 [Pseudocohnilembus persalinus]|eukprot:KRW99967.1 hypothetical protein PPERSA_00134 [Pseudocohnilembus persalinus]